MCIVTILATVFARPGAPSRCFHRRRVMLCAAYLEDEEEEDVFVAAFAILVVTPTSVVV